MPDLICSMKQQANNPEILSLPADQLPLIEELVVFMQEKGFKNLHDLLPNTTTRLLAMEGFGYRCLRSLHQFLEQHGHEDLLVEE